MINRLWKSRFLQISAFLMAVPFGLFAFGQMITGWNYRQQEIDDAKMKVIDLSHSNEQMFRLNDTGRADEVCLFPPDSQAIKELSYVFPGYNTDRKTEVSGAFWVLAAIRHGERSISILGILGVKSGGSNSRQIPCGVDLLLDNSRHFDLNEMNYSHFKYYISKRKLYCTSTNRPITNTQAALSGECQ
jgi:hypothetical protein